MPEPEDNDGTHDGRFEGACADPEVESYWDELDDTCGQTAAWWEGLWPRIHLMLGFTTLAGGLATLHFSVDLLMDLRFENSSIDTPLDDEMNDTQRNNWCALVVNAAEESTPVNNFFSNLGQAMIISLAVLSFLIAASPFPDPWKYIAMLCHFSVFGMWLMSMLLALSNEWISTEFMIGLIMAILTVALSTTAVLLISGAIVLGILVFACAEIAFATFFWAAPRFYWGIIGIAYYFLIVSIMWITLIVYLESSLANYLGVEL